MNEGQVSMVVNNLLQGCPVGHEEVGGEASWTPTNSEVDSRWLGRPSW